MEDLFSLAPPSLNNQSSVNNDLFDLTFTTTTKPSIPSTNLFDFKSASTNITSNSATENNLDDFLSLTQTLASANQTMKISQTPNKSADLLSDLFLAPSSSAGIAQNASNSGNSLLDFSFNSMSGVDLGLTSSMSPASLTSQLQKNTMQEQKQINLNNGNSGVKLAKTWEDLKKFVFFFQFYFFYIRKFFFKYSPLSLKFIFFLKVYIFHLNKIKFVAIFLCKNLHFLFIFHFFRVNIDFDNLSLKPSPAKHNPSLNELQTKKVTTSASNFY